LVNYKQHAPVNYQYRLAVSIYLALVFGKFAVAQKISSMTEAVHIVLAYP